MRIILHSVASRVINWIGCWKNIIGFWKINENNIEVTWSFISKKNSNISFDEVLNKENEKKKKEKNNNEEKTLLKF